MTHILPFGCWKATLIRRIQPRNKFDQIKHQHVYLMTLKSASCHIKESRSEECWEREQRDPIRDRERSALKGGLMKRAEFVYLSSSSPSSSFFLFLLLFLKDDCARFWLRRCKHPERAVKKKRPNASLRSYFQMPTWKREQSKTIKREKAALLSESSIAQVIQVVMEVPPSCCTLFPSAGSAAALSHLGQDKCEWLLSGLFQEAAGLTPTLASTARSVVAFATRPRPPSPACPRLSQPMRALFSQTARPVIKSSPPKFHSLGLASTRYGPLITFL